MPALFTRMSTDPNSSTTRPDRLLDLRAVCDVALDRGGAAPQLGDLLRRRLRVDEALGARCLGERTVALRILARVGLDLDVRDHDIGAGTPERQGVGPAEAARASGDERDAPGEIDLERHA